MKKSAVVLLLAISGCASAKTLPMETLQVLYDAYANLNSCHKFGYIGDEVLSTLDKAIQANRYQDNLGNVTALTQDNINYYHSLHDQFILDQQSKSYSINQSGIRFQIKTLCDQLNTTLGDRLGVKANIISPDNLPESAKPVFSKESNHNAPTIPEDRPMTWENSPVQGIQVR